MKKSLSLFAILLCIALLFCACASGTKSKPESQENESALQKALSVETEPNVRVFPQISGMVNSAVFSPDDRYVLTGDDDGAVKVWDAETGILRASYYGHEDSVMSVAWSHNGKLIASGSWDNTVKIWNADFSSEMHELLTMRHDDNVFSVAFSPNSRFVVSGSYDDTVRIWDVASGREIRVLSGHTNTVISVAFSPDGKRIASASSDRTIIIWDTKTGKKIHTLSGHTDIVRSAAWSPDSKRIVSASYDKTVMVWDVETGTVLNIIGNGVYNSAVGDAKFSPDGKYIIVVGGYLNKNDQIKFITIWDAETVAEIRHFSEHTNSIVSVAWDVEGRRILTASYDNTAKIHDMETGKCIQTFAGKTEIIRKATLSSDGKFLVTGDEGNRVNVWNAQTGVLERSLKHNGLVNAVAISPDSHIIAAGAMTSSDQIKLWDAETGNELRILRGHENTVFALAFNPFNGCLASASGDSTIRIWNTDTGAELQCLSRHKSFVVSLAFSKDGMRLVSGSYDNTVRVWELAENGQYRELRKFTGHYDLVNSVALNSNGIKIASASRDHTVSVWDIETGHSQTLTTPADIYMNGMWSVTFSPDDRFIIAGSNNNKIIRWELTTDGTYQYKDVKDKLLGVPYSISYVSNGTRILAGITDGTARLYNAEDLSEIACFVNFSGEDGQSIVRGRGASQEAEQAVSTVDGEWLSITPDGFYRGSPKGDRFINVLINGRDLTGMDAYSDFFYRPDIVYARLNNLPDPEKPKFTIQQAASFRPPAVSILSPKAGATVTGNGKVDISVSITDKNLPIQDIRILVNGVRIGGDELKSAKGTTGITAEEGGLSVKGSQKSVQFTVAVNLVEKGVNRIEVMAFNGISWGYSGYSGSVDVTWQPPAGMEVPLPDLWILAVGVNNYNNAKTEKLPDLGNLNFCASDAKELVRAFTAQEGKRYKKVHSQLLIDGEIEPTAENVRKNLSYLSQAGQRDVVLLFLAGHGISEGGQFFFLTKDAVMENGKVNHNYAISDSVLKTVMDAPGRRLVFIDACQSGGMDINDFMYSLRRTNAYMLSSSEGNKPSYEDGADKDFWKWGGHGVFSYSVIRGLEGMALPPNAAGISVLQLSGFVRNTVMDLTKGMMFRYQQKPVQYSWGFSDFDIAR